MKYIVEWSSLELVTPKLNPNGEGPHRITNLPGYVSTGGFLKVEAANQQDVLRRMRRVIPRGEFSIQPVV